MRDVELVSDQHEHDRVSTVKETNPSRRSEQLELHTFSVTENNSVILNKQEACGVRGIKHGDVYMFTRKDSASSLEGKT